MNQVPEDKKLELLKRKLSSRLQQRRRINIGACKKHGLVLPGKHLVESTWSEQ